MQGMIGAMVLATWMGIGMGGPQASSGSQAPSGPLPAAPSGLQMTIMSEPVTATDGQIYVNQECAIFPDYQPAAAMGKKPKGKSDPSICHLEGVSRSQHREEVALGNELGRSDVTVHEQEYVLQNITMKPVVFVVLEDVPKGWRVDSDPQPTEMQDNVAIFHVHAEAGETVRLHVGVRRTTELKPKALPGTTGP